MPSPVYLQQQHRWFQGAPNICQLLACICRTFNFPLQAAAWLPCRTAVLYPSLTNSLASLSATLPLRAPPIYDHHRCSVIAQAYRVCFDRAQDVAALAPSLTLPPLLLPGPRPMLTLIMLCARAGWTQLTDIKNAFQSPPYGRYARIQPAHRVFRHTLGRCGTGPPVSFGSSSWMLRPCQAMCPAQRTKKESELLKVFGIWSTDRKCFTDNLVPILAVTRGKQKVEKTNNA